MLFRSTITSIFNSGWYVGSLLAAWATYGTREYTTNWAWRIPSVLQALIPVVFAAGFLMAPESPRWLASVGRNDEARQIFIDWHAGGDESSPLAKFEYEEVIKTLALEKEANASTSYIDMFKTKGNRLRSYITITLGLSAQWAGNGIVSYYLVDALKLSGITSVTQQTLISGFLQIWNLIWAVSAAFMVDNFGRRPMFLASCLGMLGSYIVVSGLSGSFATTQNEQTGIAIIPFLFLFFASYCLAFTPLIVSYTCEIWEFSYRAKGVSMCQFVTQLAIFFNIFVNREFSEYRFANHTDLAQLLRWTQSRGSSTSFTASCLYSLRRTFGCSTPRLKAIHWRRSLWCLTVATQRSKFPWLPTLRLTRPLRRRARLKRLSTQNRKFRVHVAVSTG